MILLLLVACRTQEPDGSTDPSRLTVSLGPGAPDTTTALHAIASNHGSEAPVLFSWTVDGVSAPVSGDTVPAELTARGQTWSVMASAAGVTATASVVIVDAALPDLTVEVWPAWPIEEVDDIRCLFSERPEHDADGDALAYAVRWLRNGQPWEGATFENELGGDTVIAAELVLGDVWSCEADLTDPTGDVRSWSAEARVAALTDIPVVLFPAGDFLMGAREDDPYLFENEALHPVTLTHPFWIGVTELTVAQYREVMGIDPPDAEACPNPDCPVVLRNWDDAARFVNALSEQAGLPPCYTCEESNGVAPGCNLAWDSPYACPSWRLPTEAEWEYAARDAGTMVASFPGGGDLVGGVNPPWDCMKGIPLTNGTYLETYAWFCGSGVDVPQPVGRLNPTDMGLFDVIGNLREWTTDHYVRTPPSGADPWAGTTPEGATLIVVRGGTMKSSLTLSRVPMRTGRYVLEPTDWNGLRIARTRL